MNYKDYNTDEIAILLSTCNKYTPGFQPFRLQKLVGLQENSVDIVKNELSTANLMNADTSNLPVSEACTSSVIKIEIPYEVSRRYPFKFIPPGTRFIVSFSSGDISKPTIIGGDF